MFFTENSRLPGAPFGNARPAGHDLGWFRTRLLLRRADLVEHAAWFFPDAVVHHPRDLAAGQHASSQGAAARLSHQSLFEDGADAPSFFCLRKPDKNGNVSTRFTPGLS